MESETNRKLIFLTLSKFLLFIFNVPKKISHQVQVTFPFTKIPSFRKKEARETRFQGTKDWSERWNIFSIKTYCWTIFVYLFIFSRVNKSFWSQKKFFFPYERRIRRKFFLMAFCVVHAQPFLFISSIFDGVAFLK